MKYIIYLLGGMYIIGGIYIINTFFINKKINNNIENSIVIIIPDKNLNSYSNNPEGIFNNKKSGIGAGFFIDNKGTIQTVNHIVENDKINYKIIYKNKKYDSIILNRNEKKDLALLKIKSKDIIKYVPLKNSLNIMKNNNIISFGVDIKNMKIISNTGTIIDKYSQLKNMSNLIEISNNIKPGFSGGPIIDKFGKVIGINYAISEGKNYGIKLVKNKE